MTANPVDQAALDAIARKRGIPEVENEMACQEARQKTVIGAFLLLLFLSVLVELRNQGLNLLDVFNGLRQGAAAFLDPNAPPLAIDELAFLTGLLAVLRNMIPATAMLGLAMRFGARFMQAVHGIPNAKEANEYLRVCLFGPVGGGPVPTALAMDLMVEELIKDALTRGPFVIVKNGKVDFVVGNKQVGRIGGPGSIIVHNDSAVVLERAGQLSRIVGPGFNPLARFEKVRDVINLRPHKYATFKEHATFKVNGMSREGIPVAWPVDVYYQINDKGDNPHPASSAKPYAYSDEAVLKASTDRWLRGDEGHDHLEWSDRIVVSDAEGALRGIMARLPLDRLIRPLDDGAISSRQQVQQELKKALDKDAAKHGARIMSVDLHDIELQDPVAQQWIETWQAEWKRLATEELAEAKAERVFQFGKIKVEAQEMLLAIQDGLDKPGAEKWSISSDIFSIRLIETLQSVAAHPRVMSFADDPAKAIEAWRALHGLIGSSVSLIESEYNEQDRKSLPPESSSSNQEN
jgi:hypothetical protein